MHHITELRWHWDKIVPEIQRQFFPHAPVIKWQATEYLLEFLLVGLVSFTGDMRSQCIVGLCSNNVPTQYTKDADRELALRDSGGRLRIKFPPISVYKTMHLCFVMKVSHYGCGEL